MKRTGLALIMGAVLLAGCSTAAPVMSVNQSVVSHKMVNSGQVQTAIYQSLQRYGWQMVSDDGSRIIARYNKQNRHVAVIRIDYSAERFSINYDSSQGLDYNASRDTIHRNYNRWIKNLEVDIRSQLSFL